MVVGGEGPGALGWWPHLRARAARPRMTLVHRGIRAVPLMGPFCHLAPSFLQGPSFVLSAYRPLHLSCIPVSSASEEHMGARSLPSPPSQ